jgi:DNA-binding protein YbaB
MNVETTSQDLVDEIMSFYRDRMTNILEKNLSKDLLEEHVLSLIMTVTLHTSVNLFYSIRQYLPAVEFDVDLAAASIINRMSDGFKSLKDIKTTYELSPEQLEEISKNEFVMIELPDGTMKKVTRDQVLIKQDDAETLKTLLAEKIKDDQAQSIQ